MAGLTEGTLKCGKGLGKRNEVDETNPKGGGPNVGLEPVLLNKAILVSDRAGWGKPVKVVL